MSHYVMWRGKPYPRGFLEPFDPPPGACTYCGGVGLIAESIDEERFDVAVPCPRCRMWCQACHEWVPREHACVGEKS